MPACFLIVRRKPLQGQRFAVLEASIESFKSNGHRGLVTSSVTTLEAAHDVTNTIRFDSFDQCEEFQDRFMENEEAHVRWDNISEKCASIDVSVGEIVRPMTNLPQGSENKYIVRHIFTAKPGKRTQLIDLLKENFDSRNAPTNIVRPIGNINNIRVSRFHENLESIRAQVEFLQSSENKERHERVIELTARVSRSVSRVHYRQR
jgi:hypothetical protein